MRTRRHLALLAAVALVVGAAACADRGEMYSGDRADETAATPEARANIDRVSVTTTGCFQDMSGPNNFVLSDVSDAAGAAPRETRTYRIEQGGDFEQYIGKRVTISGWVDSDAQASGAPAGQAQSSDLDFNDLPELHVDTIMATGEACGIR